MKSVKINRLMSVLSAPVLLTVPFISLASCKDSKRDPGTGVFETDPWYVVLQHANLGLQNLKEYYQKDTFVGLEKEIKIDGFGYTVRVIGENQDYLADDEGKPQFEKPVALTFIFEQVIQEKNEYGEYKSKQFYYTDEESIRQDALWQTSLARTYLNKTFLPKINKALNTTANQNGVKKVSKRTIVEHATGKTQEAAEQLFLPSLGDFFSSEQLPEVATDVSNQNAYIEEGNPVPENDATYTRYSYYNNLVEEDCEGNEHPELAIGDRRGKPVSYWVRSCKPCFSHQDWSEWYFDVTAPSVEGQDYICTFKTTKIAQSSDYLQAAMAPIFCI